MFRDETKNLVNMPLPMIKDFNFDISNTLQLNVGEGVITKRYTKNAAGHSDITLYSSSYEIIVIAFPYDFSQSTYDGNYDNTINTQSLFHSYIASHASTTIQLHFPSAISGVNISNKKVWYSYSHDCRWMLIRVS